MTPHILKLLQARPPTATFNNIRYEYPFITGGPIDNPVDYLSLFMDSSPPASIPQTGSNGAETTINKYGQLITLNSKQLEFSNLAIAKKSCVLIGAAGTGKTTTIRKAVETLVQQPNFPILREPHKHLSTNLPGIVICAYTRRAVQNIKRSLPADLAANCITLHKTLEYEPHYYEVMDPNTGSIKTKMMFEPARNHQNPLPSSIHTIIYEEASMIGTDLYKLIQDALLHPVQEIFLGDLNQLPPVFGPAILGVKLEELPVIELTEVYRQALESPIIRLLHRILSGKPIPVSEYKDWNFPNQLTIHPWKKKISADAALLTAAEFFTKAEQLGKYDPEEDIILCPFNKSFGTDEINKRIANHLARKRDVETYEIIAGFQKLYFSVGDKVLYEKEDAEIIDIYANPAYSGAAYKLPSKNLSYHGVYSNGGAEQALQDTDIDFFLEQAAASNEDRVNQSSHIIKIRLLDTNQELRLEKTGEVSALSLGYALSVHKAQGSEWKKVFLVLHQSHATMIQRELLYTAISRAREEIYIICEPETFTNGILSQRIKGNSLKEKAEYFKGKYGNGEGMK